MDTVGDFVVKKGAWASEPRARDDAWQVFSAETDLPPEEARAAFELWWQEGRTKPGGPLTLGLYDDRVVPRNAP